jgi:SET domain-containing protein
MLVFTSNKLEVRKTENKGWGVFAKEKINQGETIEVCPLIFLPHESKQTKFLEDYRFIWVSPTLFKDPKHLMNVIPTGYGCLYNHSDNPNIAYTTDKNEYLFVFFTLENIEPNTELCHYYGNSDYWNRRSHVQKIKETKMRII